MTPKQTQSTDVIASEAKQSVDESKQKAAKASDAFDKMKFNNDVTDPIVIYDKATKPHRNEPCRCGSGKKYKHCCMKKHRSTTRQHYYN